MTGALRNMLKKLISQANMTDNRNKMLFPHI